MSSEYGTRSSAELKNQARRSLHTAEQAQPCIAVTEPNWKAMIDTQKAQLAMLTRLMDTAATLATKTEIVKYLERQIEVLTEQTESSYMITEEFQATMRQAVEEYIASMKTAISDSSKQVGRMSECFSENLSETKDTMRNYMKRIFWITVIPSAITVIYYLTPLISSLISLIF